MDILLKDLRFGLRVLARSPGFTLLAVLTFALGVGASTAVFSVVNAVLLRPLPFPDSARVVMPWFIAPIASGFGNESIPWNQQQFVSLRRETKAFASLGAFQGDTFNYSGTGEPERFDGVRASGEFFSALGVAPAMGRVFRPEEDQPGRDHEVVLGHDLWSTRFGSANMLGQSIRLNGIAYTVIGIMPAGFSFPRGEEMPDMLDFHREAQLWVPLAIPVRPDSTSSNLAVIGRLSNGVNAGQLAREFSLFTQRQESLFPEGKGWFNLRVLSLRKQLCGGSERPLLLLLGAVSVVLLIASANVANLILTRSMGRTREFIMRSALGAEEGRLVRQVLTESVLLASFGGMAGIVLAECVIGLLKLFGPVGIPRLAEVHVDAPVMFFAFAITVVLGVAFGLAPALSASRINLAESLREGTQRAGRSHSGARFRHFILVSEVALALVLVIVAALLVRTFEAMLYASPGFQPEHVLTFELTAPLAKYPDPDSAARMYGRVLQSVRSVPGVRSAGLMSYLPMAGTPDSTQIRIPGHVVSTDKEQPFANYSFTSSHCFGALGTPLLRGRDFTDADTLTSGPVTIVNQAMARKYWPGQDPLGKQVGVGSTQWPLRTIVGIVANIKHGSLREEVSPEMFVPFTQNEIKVWPSMLTLQFAARADGDASNMARQMRSAVESVDPELPVARWSTLNRIVDDSLKQTRFVMLLVGLFALLSTLLACIGLYGVISYGVAQRTQEIGIRMALGARREDVFRLVLLQGGRLVGIGLLIGLLSALAATRLISRFLFGVGATDPLTLAGVSLLLLTVALTATILPARRSTRVDPIRALRVD